MTDAEIAPDLANRKSFDSNGLQFAWDATSIEAAQTCLRKYYYSILRGIRPRDESVHLYFGGLFATALENFYKYREEGATISEAETRVVLEALNSSYGKPFDHQTKTRMSLIRTIVWYIAEYADESTSEIKTKILANGKPAVEVSFSFEISDDIILCGHLDRIVEVAGHPFVMDQKTTAAQLNERYFSSFDLHNQFSCYSYAGKAILGAPVRGVIIDSAQILTHATRFGRATTTRSKPQLDEWLDCATYTIHAARSATALNFFPMNLTACGNYGGCQFRSICKAPPKIREDLLQIDYEIREPWDPIARR